MASVRELRLWCECWTIFKKIKRQTDDMKAMSFVLVLGFFFFFLASIKRDEEESQALLKRSRTAPVSLSLNFFWKTKQMDLGSQRSFLLLLLFENHVLSSPGCVLGLNTRSFHRMCRTYWHPNLATFHSDKPFPSSFWSHLYWAPTVLSAHEKWHICHRNTCIPQ